MRPDLIVFSHLRWAGVWQRPQHLVSRLGRQRRVWFVEEPVLSAEPRPGIHAEEQPGGVTRLWIEIEDPGHHVGFIPEVVQRYQDELAAVIQPAQPPLVWLYSPLVLPAARALEPALLVFDVMDDLASFKGADPSLVAWHRRTLREADLVFAGGRTLHLGVLRHRADAHLFPSGVEPEHYARARALRRHRDVPVAGYVGVLDERLDLELVRGLAAALPDWEVRLIGPVAKIDPADLPAAPNLTYPGPRSYDELPEVMAGFDVAIMPFALNEATRAISPTKTLEYLAAGLPVVSTPVADVVSAFAAVVDVEPDADGFARACRQAREADRSQWDRSVRPLLYAHHWDTIASEMEAIMQRQLNRSESTEATA
jgi:glycosyltransferase involved in cell wall biosynthesis